MNEKPKSTIQQYAIDGGKAIEVNPSDIVMTPPKTARFVVDLFKPTGKILEPCKGNGAFLDCMPSADWCEIREGRDFFEYTEKVDWIVTNPPYSTFDEFMVHAFKLAENVVFLCPANKVINSWTRLKLIKEYGGIKKVWFVPGRRCGFKAHGFPCGAYHFQRGYRGPTEILYAD